jgi:hypothetical protein
MYHLGIGSLFWTTLWLWLIHDQNNRPQLIWWKQNFQTETAQAVEVEEERYVQGRKWDDHHRNRKCRLLVVDNSWIIHNVNVVRQDSVLSNILLPARYS